MSRIIYGPRLFNKLIGEEGGHPPILMYSRNGIYIRTQKYRITVGRVFRSWGWPFFERVG